MNSIQGDSKGPILFPSVWLPQSQGEAPQEMPLPGESFVKSETPVEKKTETIRVDGKKAPADAMRKLDEVIGELQRALNDDSQASMSLQNAGYDVRNAQSDLRRAAFPLQRVMMDNAQTNVSNEGFQLDMIFSDAKRDTSSSERNLRDSDRRVESGGQVIQQAAFKVASLERELSLEGEKYGTVLPHLRRAGADLNQAGTSTGQLDRDIDTLERSMQRVGMDLQNTSSYTMQIRFDSPGQNVSSAGYMLNSAKNRAESNLQNSDFDMRDAQREMKTTLQEMQTALDSLKQARAALGNIPA